MKYSIEGFGQERAVELGLTAEDLVLLRWFVDFYGTGKMVKHLLPEGVFAWVNYKTVLENLPIIKCNKKNLTARFKRLVDAGVLTHKTLRQGGVFSLYGFGENYDSLIYDIGSKSTQGYGQVRDNPSTEIGQRVGSNSAEQNIILQDNDSIKDSSTKEKQKSATALASDDAVDLESEFENLWKLYPRKEGKSSAKSDYIKARKDKKTPVTFDEVKKGIERYTAYITAQKTERRFIKQGSTWFHQRCWEDEYLTEGRGSSHGEDARDISENRVGNYI